MPRLPKIIHYEDDYHEVIRSIIVADSHDFIVLHDAGAKSTLSLRVIPARIRALIWHCTLTWVQNLAPSSAICHFNRIRAVNAEHIESLAILDPMKAREVWFGLMPHYKADTLISLKRLLSSLCEISFGYWTPLHRDFVTKALPGHPQDPYSTVRSGDAFLAIDEEARIVRWLDGAAQRSNALSLPDLEVTCALVCAYQFGMRPKQLGIIRKGDCTVRHSPDDGSAIVHLVFRMIKQRDPALSRLPLSRKVKREWAPLFSKLMELKKDDASDSFLFGFRSRAELSGAVIRQLDEILPDGGRVIYDLRHSMAQRLVDAGAGHEELAAALGHSQLRTGLVYFQASAVQAELINKALGVSDTYKTVAQIATLGFISLKDLAELKGDMQIGGVPHGIPIAGIGGCKSGQPNCPFNPITSCYGCPKFMPVRDLPLHRQVLQDFRSVVLDFKSTGRSEVSTPAFLQLQRTISEVQQVIQALEGNPDD